MEAELIMGRIMMKAKTRIIFFILISLYECAKNKSIGIVSNSVIKRRSCERRGVEKRGQVFMLSN